MSGVVTRGDAKIDHAHQPAVGVVEHVAMEHPAARPIVVPDHQTDRLVERHVDRVFPFKGVDVPSVLVQTCVSPGFAGTG